MLTGVNAKQKEIEIVTGMGGGDCGYSYRSGVAYVIYARKNSEGRPETGICSRTRPLTEAVEDVAYIHSVATAPESGEIRVFTTFLVYSPGGLDRLYNGGIPRRATITVQRDGFHTSLTTDVQGRATFEALVAWRIQNHVGVGRLSAQDKHGPATRQGLR